MANGDRQPSADRRKRRWWLAAVLVVVVVGVVAVVDGRRVAVPPEAPAARGGPIGSNRVVNPDFEQGALGWEGDSRTVLTLVDGYRGERALRAKGVSGAAAPLALYQWPLPVTRTEESRRYSGSLWARSNLASLTVTLRLGELSNASSQELGSSERTVRLAANRWTRLDVAHQAVATGSAISLSVATGQVGPSTWLDVDQVKLTDGSSSPSGQPRPRPQPYPIYDVSELGPSGGERATAPWTAVPELSRSTLPYSVGAVRPTRTYPPHPWRLVWHDEFDGRELDRTRWNALDFSTYGDGNGELACLTDRPENLRTTGGLLQIVAREESPPLRCGDGDTRYPEGRPYSSAHLETQETASFEFGRFEIRARTPNAEGISKGLWPAFWLRPVTGGIGELDVLEVVGSGEDERDTSDLVTQTIHYDYSGTHPKEAMDYRLPSGSFADGFHTYAAEWEPGEIRWYVDGRLTFTRDTRTTPWIAEAFRGEFYLRLNMAVGSDWLGGPDAATRLPGVFAVDYVRVYQR